MHQRVYKAIWIIWLLSTAYLLVGAVTFGRASAVGVVLIAQSQLVLLVNILISTRYIFPKFWKRGKWLWLLASIVILNLACVMLRYAIEEILLVQWLDFPKTENLNLLFYTYENFYYTLPGFFIALIIFLTVRSFEIETRNTELQSKIQEAELHMLRSQVNPHFLYNILNYIYAEALPISDKIAHTVLKLAATMRYTLAQTENRLMLLQDEVQFLQEYIDLQAVQSENGFYCVFKKEGGLDTIYFPTCMLLPFVENAFKHGVANDASTPITIDLRVSPKALRMKVENKINSVLKDDSSGIGLHNVRRRLEILFPDRHRLQVKEEGDWYYTELEISF